MESEKETVLEKCFKGILNYFYKVGHMKLNSLKSMNYTYYMCSISGYSFFSIFTVSCPYSKGLK